MTKLNAYIVELTTSLWVTIMRQQTQTDMFVLYIVIFGLIIGSTKMVAWVHGSASLRLGTDAFVVVRLIYARILRSATKALCRP